MKLIQDKFDFNTSIFNHSKHFYYYKGTMTQPPAIDFVHWYILKDILPMREG